MQPSSQPFRIERCNLQSPRKVSRMLRRLTAVSFRPRELSINGKTQRFSMINSLDHLVINTDINLVTLGMQSCLDPIIISSVLATFKLNLLVLSQQVRLLSLEVTASLRSATVLADKVTLVSSANILGAALYNLDF